MKKKIFPLLLGLTTLVGVTAGCGSTADKPATPNQPAEKIKVVTTIFPLYDWTRVLAGENNEHLEIIMLMADGVDMHSYQPTSQDLLKISTADLCVFVGGESDSWLKDALENPQNKNMIKLNLLEVMGKRAKHEEYVEGMEHEHESHEHAHENDGELDEHIWLSPKNAPVLCAAIAGALTKVDEKQTATYRQNLETYQTKLKALDNQYQTVLAAAPVKTLIFADRFPFRYLTDDYGLKYYAAFSGCSAETEASFQTVAFLSAKTAEIKPHALLTIEGRNHKLAETVAQNSGIPALPIVTLNSMQAINLKEAQQGANYLGIMEENLKGLKAALP